MSIKIDLNSTPHPLQFKLIKYFLENDKSSSIKANGKNPN